MDSLISISKRGVRKVFNTVLCGFVLPVKNMLYEITHRDYVILSTSVLPMYKNWGDYVSKVLVELINPSRKVIVRRYSWNINKHDDYLCIGSIITWMTTPRSVIWGSGVVYPDKEISALPKKVLAVRGPLTRQYLLDKGIDCPPIYGDPALLFPRYYTPKVKKNYRYGIIPHFRDKNNDLLGIFRNRTDCLIIDVQDVNPWHKFIDCINQCEIIFSSSLHGIIMSDAYSVPNVWIEFDGGEKKRFAFMDYFQSVGKSHQLPIVIDGSTTIEYLSDKSKNWTPPSINTEVLLRVCPFI